VQATTEPRGFTYRLVYLFERLMPDPFVLALALTALVVIAAAIFAPRNALPNILNSWYSGVFNIFGFAFQMIMILVSGHALAHSTWVLRGLNRLVSFIHTPNQAIVLTFLTAAVASWLNWGFGLVVGAVLAREVARHIRLDFAWLVAAAYSGWVVWASGPSGSIPLAQASHDNSLNVVEKITGQLLPLSETIFTAFTIVPTLVMLVIVPVVIILARPAANDEQIYSPPEESARAIAEQAPGPLPFARRAERSPTGSIFLVVAGVAYFVLAAREGTIRFDANMVIFIFVILGVALHRTPIAYAAAVRDAAKQTGSMMLQYPIYGGIMGIMTGTGLAQVIALSTASIASAHTLPIIAFVTSLFITCIVPSGGGHWAVQGPFAIPAAVSLHASLAGTTMAVAFGEQVANMVQPFWALPVVAIAGIGVQRVLGFTTLTFFVGTLVYGAALLLLV
jgi:short-chain fatty acids transporter